MKMKNLFMMFALVLFAATVTYAQDSDVETGDVTKNAKSRGTDPNITSDDMVNSLEGNSNAHRPASKGGESRGGDCRAYFDNWTQWILQVYVDGSRRGVVDGYSEGGVWVPTGNTKMYAVARFTDGSYYSWGPGTKYCGYLDRIEMEVHDDYFRLFVE